VSQISLYREKIVRENYITVKLVQYYCKVFFLFFSVMQSLSSKIFSPRRCYSSPSALKLWVKHNGAPSTQVPINGCTNIDDFAEMIKQKLNTNCQVSVFSSLEKDALRPGLTIHELLKMDGLKRNSDESPLLVKLIPATQDSIASKTIYIRDIDHDGKFTDEYIEYEVKNKEDLRDIYKNGRGLVHLSNPKKAIVSFDEIEYGKKYQVFRYLQEDSIASKKTIYIRDIDEECRPLDSYTEVLVGSDADMKEIYESKGSALYLLTEPKKLLTKFKQLKDGEKYDVFSRYEQSFSQELRWQQMEDRAMEEEVALAMKNYLHSHVGSNVIEMPTDVVGTGGKIVQEWDAAFKVDDVLYLCEAKHVMCIDKVPKIPQRIKMFKEQFQLHAQEEFSIGINKIVGVACGTYFPPLVRKKAHELGLICVYPTGWRYYDDKKLPKGFKIEF